MLIEGYISAVNIRLPLAIPFPAHRYGNLVQPLSLIHISTGAITDELREDWQLVDVMKELNWEKYKVLGLVE